MPKLYLPKTAGKTCSPKNFFVYVKVNVQCNTNKSSSTKEGYLGHLFLSSEIAKGTWCFFNSLMNISSECLTINHMIVKQWKKPKRNNLPTWFLKTLPCIIIWNIWKSRCKSKFEDYEMHCFPIISNIISNFVDIYNAHNLTLAKGNLSVECLSFFKFATVEKYNAAIGEMDVSKRCMCETQHRLS